MTNIEKMIMGSNSLQNKQIDINSYDTVGIFRFDDDCNFDKSLISTTLVKINKSDWTIIDTAVSKVLNDDMFLLHINKKITLKSNLFHKNKKNKILFLSNNSKTLKEYFDKNKIVYSSFESILSKELQKEYPFSPFFTGNSKPDLYSVKNMSIDVAFFYRSLIKKINI